jgi:hypothetical protein
MAWDRGLKMTTTGGHKHDELASFKDAVGRGGMDAT